MKRKFYRANLPNVVWNPETSKPLASFVRGQFTTEDESVAAILVEKGYPEIELDAETPPPIPDPPVQTGDVNVKIMGEQVTEETILSKHKRETMMKGEEKGRSKRKIKRRAKG